MRKIISVIAALSLLATVAIGGTVAYLTDTEERVNVLTVGNVNIELHEEQRNREEGGLEGFPGEMQLSPVIPADPDDLYDDYGLSNARNYVDKIVSVKNVGQNPAYLRVFVAIPRKLDSRSGGPLHWDAGIHFNRNSNGPLGTTADDWQKNEYPFYRQFGLHMGGEGEYFDGYNHWYSALIDGEDYNIYQFEYHGDGEWLEDENGNLYKEDPLFQPDERTTAVISGLYLDSSVNYDDDKDTWYFIDEDGEKKDIDFDLNNDVYIPVMAVAVQAEGFAWSQEAFTAAGFDDNNDPMDGHLYNPWEDGLNDVIVNNQEELNAAIESNEGRTIVLNPFNGVYTIPGEGDFRGASNTTINVKIIDGTATDLHLENVEVSGATRVNVSTDQDVYFRNVKFVESLNVYNQHGEFAADKCYIRNLTAEAEDGFETKYSRSTFAGSFTVGQDKGAHNFYDCWIEKDVDLKPYLIENSDGDHVWYDDKQDDGVFFHGTYWDEHIF